MGLFSHSKDNGRDIVKKIEKLKHHIIKTKDPQKEYTVFTKIINKFFEEKYNVHYKFTYEDLKYELLELMENNKFSNTEFRNLSNGISAIHSGWKI